MRREGRKHNEPSFSSSLFPALHRWNHQVLNSQTSHSNSQDNRALGDPQAVASYSLSGLNCGGGAGGGRASGLALAVVEAGAGGVGGGGG